MESRAPLDENVIKVVSFAFDNCLAHKSYADEVKAVLFNNHQDCSLLKNQNLISANLIKYNELFLEHVAQDAIASKASTAILLNGSAERQAGSSDISNADNGRGLFFFAQEALINHLNARSNVGGIVWHGDPYVLADTHNKRNVGETYEAAIKGQDDNAGCFFDPSNLLLLYTQMFKMAGKFKNKSIQFDFYSGNLEANQQLHKFLNANKDFIPRNLQLRIHTYSGSGQYVDGKGFVPSIVSMPEIIGECDMELDFHQAYRNLIKAHEKNDVPFQDILATFMPPDSASAAEKLAAAERLKAFKQLRQNELLELVAAMDAVKQLLPRVGDDRHLTEEAQSFSDSLDGYYWKIDAELTKTKNGLKPVQREKKVPQSDAVAAAGSMTRFLQSIVSNAAIQDANQKATAHIESLATFSKAFNSDHRFRVFKDVAKGAGISFGMLLLAGAIGAGIGFGVGFAIAGPAGAVVVGILGAIIGGAVAAAIGASIAAPVSGVSIYKKQHERRESEAAAKNVLELADLRAIGFAAG